MRTFDAPDRAAAAFAIVDELTAERGLVTAEAIPAMRAAAAGRSTGGLRLASWRDWQPTEAPGVSLDPAGARGYYWYRVMELARGGFSPNRSYG